MGRRESVSETVIAAVLLLHERSVEEVQPKLTNNDLEPVIKLVARPAVPILDTIHADTASPHEIGSLLCRST